MQITPNLSTSALQALAQATQYSPALKLTHDSNNGQWQPQATTAWYQPTSYTTWYQTHPAGVVTITSTVPCPPVSTVVYYTTDCNNCCYDNNCCRNQFGGTCWDPNQGGAVGT
jgi:hypothetical protein